MLCVWNRRQTHMKNERLFLIRNNWSSDVKTVMDTLDVNNSFQNQSVIVLQLVRTRIPDYYKKAWKVCSN